jgi:hypothetical protein
MFAGVNRVSEIGADRSTTDFSPTAGQWRVLETEGPTPSIARVRGQASFLPRLLKVLRERARVTLPAQASAG